MIVNPINNCTKVIPVVTILLRALEKAPNDHGVIMWKANLRKSVLERLGDLEVEECYSVATLLDPRYFSMTIEILIIIFKVQGSFFFRSKVFLANAKEKLAMFIESELSKDREHVEVKQDTLPVVDTDPIDQAGTSCSITEQIAKKIRLEKKQQVNITL